MPRENTSLKCILISLSLLLLTGCGATSQTATSTQKTVTTPANTQAESKEKGYIYQSDNQAVFINWTEDNNNFVGQMQVTDLTDSGIQSSNHAFNGVLNGTNLSLTITGSILNDGWTGKVFTGSLDSNSKLTLLFPSTNGMMNLIRFTSGTIADFNDEVSALTQTYAKMQSDKQAQAQRNGQMAKQQGILDSLPQMDKKVRIDTTTLASLSFSDILSQYDASLKQMQRDYTRLKADANVQPNTSVQLGTVQVDLDTLKVDLSSLGVHAGSMQVVNNEIQISLKTLQDDIKNYNTLWSNYQNIGGKGSAILADEMSSSISNAQAQISKASDTMKSAQVQADSYKQQAQDLLNTAEAFVSGLNGQNVGNG